MVLLIAPLQSDIQNPRLVQTVHYLVHHVRSSMCEHHHTCNMLESDCILLWISTTPGTAGSPSHLHGCRCSIAGKSTGGALTVDKGSASSPQHHQLEAYPIVIEDKQVCIKSMKFVAAGLCGEACQGLYPLANQCVGALGRWCF